MINLWNTCKAQYNLHYNEKLRSDKVSSAFLFGGAVDEACNILLLRKKKKLTKEEKELIKKDPMQVFEENITFRTLKKEIGPEDISANHLIEYYKSDFDPGVLLEDDYVRMKKYMVMVGYAQLEDPRLLDDNKYAKLVKYLMEDEEIDPIKLYNELREKKNLELTDQCFINFCCWLSVRRKGHLLVECYEKEILPKIKVVHSIQKFVNLPNDEGDTLIGFIDLECEFEDYDGIFTADNKTSSSKFKQKDINDKPQLLIYDEFTGHGQAAYIVLQKKPKYIKTKSCQDCDYTETGAKRKCPECGGKLEVSEVEPIIDWEIIVDSIDEEKKDLLFEEISGILSDMKAATKYPQNRDSCFQYGRKCVYYDHCRNGSTKGLSKQGKKK